LSALGRRRPTTGDSNNSGLIGHSAEFAVSDLYSVDVTSHSGWAAVQLRGEVDIHAVPQLRAAMASALLAAPDSLRIDLAEVTYLSLSAMGVILAARDRAVRAQTHVIVFDAPRALHKFMDLIDPAGISSKPTTAVA
jgi:anti-anti-sigma factor